jgi:hypothetical protein
MRQQDGSFYAPLGSQMALGLPSTGDTLHFFKTMPLPYNTPASSDLYRVAVDVGSGQCVIEDSATVMPAGQFAITEVNYNPVAGKDQWFEVQNNTAQAINLAGWTLDFGGGVTHTLSSSTGTTVLPANGRLVFGQTSTAAEGATVNYVYGSSFAMPTSAGSLSMVQAGGRYSTVSWTSPGTQGVSLQIDAPRTDLLFEPGLKAVSCPSTATYGTFGQKGTPGAVNSNCFPWKLTTVPAAFQYIYNTGRAVPGLLSTGSYSIMNVDSGLDFTAYGGRAIKIGGVLYGNATNKLNVDSNGYISLSSNNSTGTNVSLPTSAVPNGLIAPWWNTLSGLALGGLIPSGVYWQQFDPNGIPGDVDDYTLISWENWGQYNVQGRLDFQVKFYEATGNIEYYYGTHSNGVAAQYTDGSMATIWMESLDGRVALPISVNHPFDASVGYRFTYAP